MNVYTCNYNELYKILREETIVIFGLGEYFHFYVEESFPYDLRKNIVYFIVIDSIYTIYGYVCMSSPLRLTCVLPKFIY